MIDHYRQFINEGLQFTLFCEGYPERNADFVMTAIVNLAGDTLYYTLPHAIEDSLETMIGLDLSRWKTAILRVGKQ